VTGIAMGPNDYLYTIGFTNSSPIHPFLQRLSLEDTTAPPTIQFNRQVAAIGEGSVIPLTVLRQGSATGIVTAQFTTRADSATEGIDFIATNGVITFQPGERFKTISIQTLSDADARPDRNFFVDLPAPIGAALGENSSLQVTVVDRQSTMNPIGPPLLPFSETLGTNQFTISRATGSPYELSVHWKVAPVDPAILNPFITQEGDAVFMVGTSNLFFSVGFADNDIVNSNIPYVLTIT